MKVSAAAVGCAFVVASPGVAATDPPVDVPASAITRTLVCQPAVAPHHGQPVLLLGSTANDGADLWTWGFQRALLRAGHPSCYLGLPQHGTGDLQVAARRVVLAIRAVRARAHRRIAIYGVGQGALVARLALTGWPDERRLVSDVLSVSGLQHGTQLGVFDCDTEGCPAALWQRGAESGLLAALKRFADETPGPTAWTSVWSLDDIVATPQDGPSPTSALAGATNLVVQAICPGRFRLHYEVAFDSLTFAALRDALTHRGPAQRTRLKRPCAPQFAPGLTDVAIRSHLNRVVNRGFALMRAASRLNAEPAVLPPFAGT